MNRLPTITAKKIDEPSSAIRLGEKSNTHKPSLPSASNRSAAN